MLKYIFRHLKHILFWMGKKNAVHNSSKMNWSSLQGWLGWYRFWKQTTKCELFWLVKHCWCTCVRSNSDLRSISEISEPEKRETKQKVLIKANQPLIAFYEVGQTHQVSCRCFQAQKSVNMLTSLKLNAVQVIKFAGEYNVW